MDNRNKQSIISQATRNNWSKNDFNVKATKIAAISKSNANLSHDQKMTVIKKAHAQLSKKV